VRGGEKKPEIGNSRLQISKSCRTEEIEKQKRKDRSFAGKKKGERGLLEAVQKNFPHPQGKQPVLERLGGV